MVQSPIMRLAGALVLSISSLILSLSANADHHGKIMAAIKATNEIHIQGFNSGDPAMAASVYTVDGTLMADGAYPVKGRAKIEEVIEVSDGSISIMLDTTEVDVVSDTTAIETGIWLITLNGSPNDPPLDKGDYVVIWKKQDDGKWLWHIDIFNSHAAIK